ncbi:hypothetical protein ABIE33_006484 [Ensifer sp. 4252]
MGATPLVTRYGLGLPIAVGLTMQVFLAAKQSDEHRKGRPMPFKGRRMILVCITLAAVAIVQIALLSRV